MWHGDLIMLEKIHQNESIQRIWSQRQVQEGDERAQVNQHISLPKDKVTLSHQAEGNQENKGREDEEKPTPDQQREINQLKSRDAEVKAHERAHMAAGGGLVRGGASYQYQRGPDGRTYAVGGEVSIDVSSERTPDATIRKMQQVKAAALAPAQPSGTDRAVAARATQMEAQARAEKNTDSESDEKSDAPAGADASPVAQTPQSPSESTAQNSESTDAMSQVADDGPFTYQRFRSGNRQRNASYQNGTGKKISISA